MLRAFLPALLTARAWCSRLARCSFSLLTLHRTHACTHHVLLLPGEFEKHAGCWMGWPYDKYLWREDAVPAKKQYAAVAKAISEFEPV